MTEQGLYKRGRVWWICYADSTGKTRRESSGTPDFRAAKRMLVEKRKMVSDGNTLPPARVGKHTFKQLATAYRAWAAHQRAWNRKVYSVKALEDVFGDVPLAKISPRLIDQYLSGVLSGGRKASTRNRYLATLGHMFTKAKEWEMVDAGTCERVHSVKMLPENNKRLRYLTLDECRHLVSACGEHLLPIVVTAMCTGMRKGEILGLRWSQVDLDHRYVRIEITKGGEPRQIPISGALHSLLSSLPTRSEFMFCDRNGQRYRDVKRAFRTACKNAGIVDFRFHDLRHTFASHATMSGVDLATLKDLLGHASIKMTLRYSHLAPGHRRAAVEGISDRLSLPASTSKFTSQNAIEMKKGPGLSSEAFELPGGAERDRTVAILNTVRNTAPTLPEIINRYGYDDDATGD